MFAFRSSLRGRSARLLTSPPAIAAWRVALLLLIVAVSYLALTPTPPARLDTGWDKLNHALAFSALSIAGYFAFPGSRGRWLAIVCGLVALGGMIEVLQLFVPGRNSEWGDLLADSVGILAGSAMASWTLGALGLRSAPSVG